MVGTILAAFLYKPFESQTNCPVFKRFKTKWLPCPVFECHLTTTLWMTTQNPDMSSFWIITALGHWIGFFIENEQFPHTLTKTSVTRKEFPTPSYFPSLSSKLGLSPHNWPPTGSGFRTGSNVEILREGSEMRWPLIEELRRCRNTRGPLNEFLRCTSSSRRQSSLGSCWREGASGWDSW